MSGLNFPAPGSSGLDHDRFEADAGALIRHWVPAVWAGRPELARDEWLSHLLQGSAAAGDPRLAWLSDCMHAMCLARGSLSTEDLQQVEQTLARMRRHGWERAVRLAEAALMHALFRLPARLDEGLALVEGQGKATDDPRPPLERLWTDACAALLLASRQRFEEALQHGLVANDLAESSAVPEVHVVALRVLSYVLLSLGDVEDALVALRREQALVQAHGLEYRHTAYNLALALLLSGQPREVIALAGQLSWMREPEWLHRLPPLAGLLAAAHAACSELAASQSYLSQIRPLAEQETSVLVNLLWLSGLARIAVGEARRAASEIQAFLKGCEAQAEPDFISPMNATQMYRVLSEALEACGDAPGALAALRQSQLHSRRWVGQSVRSHLMAQLHGAIGEQGDRMARRLKGLDAQLKQLGVAAEAPPLRLPVNEAPAPSPDASRQYLAEVAHELRNPLNGVIGFTSLLTMSTLDARNQRYADMAHHSAQVLLRLCNELLDLARMDAGKLDLRPAPTNLRALTAEVLGVVQTQADAKPGLVLRAELAASLPPSLLVDGLRLQQILMNLIGNALKFTSVGEVVVSLRWDADPGGDGDAGRLLASVRDTGPGFDAAEADLLFNEFSQLDSPQRRDGAGLGLAICHRLVTYMGGHIRATSQPGRGSEFSFELPLRQAPASQETFSAAPA